MKNFSLLSIFAILLLNGCALIDEQYKQDIVGTWSYYHYDYDDTQTDEKLLISVEGKISFTMGMRFKDISVATFTWRSEDYGEVKLKYQISINGTYDIKNTYLILNYFFNNLEFKQIKTAQNNYLIDYYVLDKWVRDNLPTVFQAELLKNSKGSIDEMTKNRMVVSDQVYQKE
ncbi:hypothetical protein AGMMS4956_03980 [Bacteroidia bacterium]|nr:hypothetical protein AGMMS4956_03980 [Bacteroidia bacterium]